MNLYKRLKSLSHVCLLAATLASTAHAGTIFKNLSWTGAGGYTMTGNFSYSDTLSGPITGSQLSSFFILGLLNGSPIGSWDLSSGFAGFLFNFNFDATTGLFALGGDTTTTTGQAWNIVNGGLNCPNPGFGFGSGSGGQGVCKDNGLVIASVTTAFNLTASDASGVPEPASVSLLLGGLGACALLARRRPRNA